MSSESEYSPSNRSRDDESPPMVIPVHRPAGSVPRVPAPPSRGGGFAKFLVFLLLMSLGANFLLCLGLMAAGFSGLGGDDGGGLVREKHWGGQRSASDKVAVIPVTGVLIDEMINPVLRCIDKAAKDSDVKAVVVRINSPGGTITASDAIHKRLSELRLGNSPRFESNPKHLVVSMGAMAASGGYYIAMPAEFIFAEKTTITGSIGVYASLLNVHKLANDHGVKMELIKAGDMKSSGSMFHELLPQERQIWQEMVDNAYAQFLSVVEAGRPHLKGMLTRKLERVDGEGKPLADEAPVYDEKGNLLAGKKVPYERKLADGGIFTAHAAKHYKLVDEIGYLEDAARKAASLAGLSEYRIVMYEPQLTFFELLMGEANESSPPNGLFRLAAATGPRVWYLAPNSEFLSLATQIRPSSSRD
jgi:protease-4